MSDSVRQAIDTANAKYLDAIASGDAAACARTYAPEASLMVTGFDPFQGRQAIANGYEQWFRDGVKQEEHATLELDVVGDTAIEVVAWVAKGERGVELDRGKCLVVWKKNESAEWLVHRSMSISSGPAA